MMLLLISFMPFEKTQINKIKSVGYTKNRSFLVTLKVRFLAMTMFEQARRCSFGLTKTFFSRSSKSAFSRHDSVRASSTLFIWLNENVLFFRSALQLSIFVAYNEERVMLGRSNKA